MYSNNDWHTADPIHLHFENFFYIVHRANNRGARTFLHGGIRN
jgi:hypothetical protein